MPYHSRWMIPIPDCSLPTFLFTSATTDLTDRPQYIDAADPSINITRNGYRSWSSRFALGLQRSGIFKPGDRVLIFSSNAMMYPIAFMGIVMAGGIFSGANPGFTARELAYQWKNAGASILLCMEPALEIGLQAAKEAGMKPEQIFVFDSKMLSGQNGDGAKGLRNWSELFVSEEEAKGWQWEELKGDGEADNTTLALNYSSGTTGFPKGVEITHKNYVSNTIQHQHLATMRRSWQESKPDIRWLLFLPLYHAMAQTIFLAGGFMHGVPVYIMPKFDFEMMLQCVEKYKIMELSLVPPIAVMLAKSPLVKKYDISSVKWVGSGAAPLGADVSAQVENVLGGSGRNLKQGWGMTEVTCSILGWDPMQRSDSFSVGEPNANTSAKIMKIGSDSNGNETFTEITERGPEHRGELWVSGQNVMKGYWRNPKATEDTFAPASASQDGKRWLRSGDVAYVDEHGHFFIVDRIKELIKVKGNQVAPAELEALLLEHEAVQDVAVIGVPTPDGDEVPRAYVVLQEAWKEKITEDELIKWVEKKVIQYKRLRGGIEFVPAIPKNPSGKILRKFLREEYKKTAEAKEGRARL